MNRREFLQLLGIGALAIPKAYSFLGSGIWTPLQVKLDVITAGSFDVVRGEWTHVLVQGFANPESNGYFKITGTDYEKGAYTLERTQERLKMEARGDVTNMPVEEFIRRSICSDISNQNWRMKKR